MTGDLLLGDLQAALRELPYALDPPSQRLQPFDLRGGRPTFDRCRPLSQSFGLERGQFLSTLVRANRAPAVRGE